MNVNYYVMKTFGAYGVEVQHQHSWPRHFMEVSGQLHGPAAVPSGRSPWYPLNMRLDRPQNQPGHCVVEKSDWGTLVARIIVENCIKLWFMLE
jgi:hypothetical protein